MSHLQQADMAAYSNNSDIRTHNKMEKNKEEKSKN
jgi:hypothetical protein